MQNQKILLYLPIGTIESERLLLLTMFESQKLINVRFLPVLFQNQVLDKQKKEILKKENNHHYENSNEDLSLDPILNYNLKSSFFKKSIKIQNKLNFSKITNRKKQNSKHLTVKKFNRPYIIYQGWYKYGFKDILKILIKKCTFSIDVLKKNQTKLFNYLYFIENNIDFSVNELLTNLYQNNKTFAFQSQLKKLINNLKYYEEYSLIQNKFLISDEPNIIDLVLLSSLNWIFKFFFQEKIRKVCLPNLSSWFIHLTSLPRLKSFYSNFKMCKYSFVHLLSDKYFDIQKLIKNSENSQNIQLLKNLLNQCIKNEDNQKQQANLFKKFKFQDDYSLWYFQYIKISEDDLQSEDSFESTEDECQNFFTSIQLKVPKNKWDLLLYMVLYSNTSSDSSFFQEQENDLIKSDLDKMDNFPKSYFKDKNIKGFLLIKGQKLEEELEEQESNDQIFVKKLEISKLFELISDVLKRKDLFSMDIIHKEVII